MGDRWGIKQDDNGKWHVYYEDHNNPPLINAMGSTCTCDCHRIPMRHIVPCCWPRKEPEGDTLDTADT